MKRIFFILLPLALLLLFLYIVYKSEIILEGLKREAFLKYYIISGCLFFISLFVIFLSEKLKNYIFILFIIFFTIIYSLEIYLNFNEYTHQKNKVYSVLNFNGEIYDTRLRFEVYNDIKKNDENVSLSAGPSSFLNPASSLIFDAKKFFPLSSKSNSNTINCNSNGYYSIYKSDRYGFNNPDTEWDYQDIDYLFIGDSFAQGCENRPNDLPSKIRNLSGKTTINLGLPGNGPLLEYASLKEYSKDKNIKNIIWLFYEKNDLDDLVHEFKNEVLYKYFKNKLFSQNLKNKQRVVDDIVERYNQIEVEKGKIVTENKKIKTKFIKFIKLSKVRGYFDRPKLNSFETKDSLHTKLVNFNQVTKLIKEISDEKKSNLYFVYLPELKRYKNFKDNEILNNVKKIITQQNIKFINIDSEVFAKEVDPKKLFSLEILGFNYYNTEGYNKISQRIFEIINNQ